LQIAPVVLSCLCRLSPFLATCSASSSTDPLPCRPSAPLPQSAPWTLTDAFVTHFRCQQLNVGCLGVQAISC
jgi:hypothetical protein